MPHVAPVTAGARLALRVDLARHYRGDFYLYLILIIQANVLVQNLFRVDGGIGLLSGHF